MDEEINTFTVAASSLDYRKLLVSNDSYVIDKFEMPLEKVNGLIDKFEEETNARKKDIEDLKFFTKISEEAICQSFDANIDLIKKEVQEIKNQLFICMSIFGSLILFLLFGFIYCMVF